MAVPPEPGPARGPGVTCTPAPCGQPGCRMGASRGQHRAAPSLEPKAASTPLPEQTSWAPGGYYAQGEGLLIQVTR